MSTQIEKIAEIMIDGCNAIEAAAINMRRRIADEILKDKEALKQNNQKPQPAPTVKGEFPGSTSLDSLPWRSHHRRDNNGKTLPANPNEAGWIFTETKGAETLTAQLKTADKITVGNMDYSFSGDGKFISRKPTKN